MNQEDFQNIFQDKDLQIKVNDSLYHSLLIVSLCVAVISMLILGTYFNISFKIVLIKSTQNNQKDLFEN